MTAVTQPQRWPGLPLQSLLMILFMTVMMGLVLSAAFTWSEQGFAPGFVPEWLSRFASTYVIVLPTVLVVAPLAQRLAAWVAGLLGRQDQDIREAALEAWRQNGIGHAGKGFDGWIAMLTDDVSITMPTGAYRGENLGKAAAIEIYTAIAAANPLLTYLPPKRIAVGGDTVVLEFDGHGTVVGHDCSNNMAVSFDIEHGKVRAYREYIGDIDPAEFAFLSNCRRANKGSLNGSACPS